MAVAGNVQVMTVGQRFTDRIIKLTFTGSYVTGGDTINLVTLTNTFGIDGAKQFSRLPRCSFGLSDPGGFYFEVIPGATLQTFKIKVYQASGTELAAGAYPGGLTAPPTDPLIQLTHVNH